jgi:colanic acid/amylovoran biosynthesis glycosyltransferase
MTAVVRAADGIRGLFSVADSTRAQASGRHLAHCRFDFGPLANLATQMSSETTTRTRPAVSVVMPFYGDSGDARGALQALDVLALRPQDEIVVADNSREGSMLAEVGDRSSPKVVGATDQFGSYYARNAGAEVAAGEWLLFLDSDCVPPADLIDAYFANPPGERCGILAGGVEGSAEQQSAVARWSRSRSALRSEVLSEEYEQKMGVTANLMARRDAWEAVGGFQERIRSHGDTEFCWRVQDAGWELMHAPDAAVEHLHRETVGALARVSARYGAGAAWLNRHRPESCPKPRPVRDLARCAVGAPWFALTGRFERALFKLIDAVSIAAHSIGYLRSNRPPERGAGETEAADRERPATAIVCDSFPVLAETFIAAEAHALADAGTRVRLEAVMRPERPNPSAGRGLGAGYVEDEGYLRRIGSLLDLIGRHPVRVAQDFLTRGRWPADERVPLVSLAPMVLRLGRWGAAHLHAHFATGAAVTAARVARFLGVRYSVTAHAYEIFGDPEPLQAKLDGAAFVTTGCRYNVNYLRRNVLNARPPIHEIVMGVDPARFERGAPYPGGRRVLAVGRLVPKKGFPDLIEAAALLERDRPLDALVIAGAGPRRAELETLIQERGLGPRVHLLGGLDPGAVRAEMERADLLAMPCVVAPDGDRDSMPVVVKEALAMEIPVVATDEVGLPELVRPEFGRLAPPGDPPALAQAIAELLALDPGERARMGSAGRAWVTEHANVTEESRRLAALIDEASGGTGGR